MKADTKFINYMQQRLKRWESPRKEGRNDKGKGGSARQRQVKKQMQMLRQKLKDQRKGTDDSQSKNKKGENQVLSFFLSYFNLDRSELILRQFLTVNSTD